MQDKCEQTRRSKTYQRIRHSGCVENERKKKFTKDGVHNIKTELNHLVRSNQIIEKKKT